MRVLSGIKPSGIPHLGNYFGAMKKYLDLQNEHECFFFLADLHALTTIRDPQLLKKYSMEIALSFLSIGLDPAKSVLFRHSDVKETTELAWILSCVCPLGLLERCHAYKDALSKNKNINHGVFAYPVLMAADILLYQSELVPVGKDQKQHLEVSRDLAESFNTKFGEAFTLPEALIEKESETIIGTDGRKMSKSYDNTISLFEDEKSVRKKIMSIKTDSVPLGSPLDPEKCAVFALHKIFANPDLEQLRERYQQGKIGFGDSKKLLFELFLETFAPIRNKRQDLEKNPDYLEEVLKKWAERAREESAKTMKKVRKLVFGS